MKEKIRSNNLIKCLIAVVVALLVPAILGFSEYLCLIACFATIYIVAVSGLDVLFGYSGQISMGHAAFYAIGAYGAGILYKHLGVPQIPAMLIASVIACGIGALLALPASKLKFHFLSLATIAFGEIVYQIASHSPNNITGNFNGFFTDKLHIFGLQINTNVKFYFFGVLCVVVFLIIKNFIVKSRTGRALIAIRENTQAAEGMGVNVRKYKVIAFAVSAFFVAFAGGMYVNLVGYLHPDMYQQKQSVLFVTMMLFGGSGSLTGPVIGAVAVEVILESLRMFEEYQMLIYGILLLLVILAMPGGLVGAAKDLKRNILRRKALKQAGKEVK
ncbi:branched-chain amino acid ABC transporter permease [Qiania dongpingensis]|uniref:Branched-chain amino acid ABC transporter permease n=1 Tax=Qiania dongpingensis TaxID=2763669 RepID=A0A7G9G7A3_9FIRM|nr:branched-chain amino acid ABC transporter permease [Qiania dongpingensis]QNM06685.1 branched-chain amino acid ABC transporter permease [Qiania dongpingensis]